MDGRMEVRDILSYLLRRLLKREHPRICLKLFFEVEPFSHSVLYDRIDPHISSLKLAEEQATEEDDMEKKYGRR